jgi:hypothetical protein
VRAPPPAELSRQVGPTATWITVEYINEWDSQARAAFEYAVDIWDTQINPSVGIKISAEWKGLGQDILGSAAPTRLYANFGGAPMGGTWYPVPLANTLAEEDLNGPEVEIAASFNREFPDWYFGTDGATPLGQWDFVTVVLHEIAHGLGLVGSMRVSYGVGSWGYSTGTTLYPLIYDRFTENGGGQALLIAFPNYSAELAFQLQGGDIFFDGPAARTSNAGSRVELFAPYPWLTGSSYCHVDEIFNDTPNALMTYSIANGESIHDPGPVVRGILTDIGWPSPDLAVGQHVEQEADLAPGEAVTILLSVANLGTSSARSVLMTDLVSPDILSPSYQVSASLAGTTHRPGTTYEWDLPDLNRGVSGVITLTGILRESLPPDWAVVNQVTAATADRELDLSNNHSLIILGGYRTYLPLAIAD